MGVERIPRALRSDAALRSCFESTSSRPRRRRDRSHIALGALDALVAARDDALDQLEVAMLRGAIEGAEPTHAVAAARGDVPVPLRLRLGEDAAAEAARALRRRGRRGRGRRRRRVRIARAARAERRILLGAARGAQRPRAAAQRETLEASAALETDTSRRLGEMLKERVAGLARGGGGGGGGGGGARAVATTGAAGAADADADEAKSLGGDASVAASEEAGAVGMSALGALGRGLNEAGQNLTGVVAATGRGLGEEAAGGVGLLAERRPDGRARRRARRARRALPAQLALRGLRARSSTGVVTFDSRARRPTRCRCCSRRATTSSSCSPRPTRAT